MGFNWSKDLERATLKLWHVVSSRFQKQMKTAKEKREWLRKKLVEMKRDGKLLASHGENDVEDLTDDVVKNKIDGLKKLGKKMMEKWIVPILKRNKKEPPTGSGVDDDDQQLDCDAIEEVDWSEIENKCKWHLVRLYFELFGDHPTWGCGLGGAVDTATVVCEESQGATKLVVAAPVGETKSTSSTSSEDDGAAQGVRTKRKRHELVDHDMDSDDDDDDDDTLPVTPPPKAVKAEQKATPTASGTSRVAYQQQQFLTQYADIQAQQQEKEHTFQVCACVCASFVCVPVCVRTSVICMHVDVWNF